MIVIIRMVTNKNNGDNNMNDLYSKYDLCETLKLSVGTIDNKMKDGSLDYYKIGRSVRFDDNQIETFLRKFYPKKHLAKSITDVDVSRLRQAI